MLSESLQEQCSFYTLDSDMSINNTGFSELSNFVNIAVRNRKYAEATGHGLKAALNLFDKELKEEERESLDVFKSRFDAIYRSVFSGNTGKFTASSLEVYKRRVKKVLSDYEKYGIDPTKMANWNPKTVVRPKQAALSKKIAALAPETEESSQSHFSAGNKRVELPLRADAKVVVLLPKDVTSADIEKIKTLLDLVETRN